MNSYRTSPQVRAAVRAVVLGVFVYLATVFSSGHEAFDLEPFVWGLGATLVRSVLGFLTPIEPLVGVKTQVEVPADTTHQTHGS